MKNTMMTTTICSGLWVSMALAGPWPGWRGSDFSGSTQAGAYPVTFSPTQGVLWTLELPGPGSSTPAVWGDRMFLTAGVNRQDTALCLDLDGKELWRRSLGEERNPKNRSATGSNPSPVTDGERVFVYFKSGTLAALDFDGTVVWKRNIQEEYGPDRLLWDLGTSPVLTRDAVVIAVMQERDAYLLALDRATGKQRWKAKRNLDSPAESNDAYTTPQVVEADGEEIIITWGADHVTAHRADDGKELWRCGGFNPQQRRNWRTIASAVAHQGMVVVPYGRGGALAGVRIGGKGDVTKSAVVWNRELKGPDVPTPAVRDGLAYVLGDHGDLTCLDIRTGAVRWAFELPKERDNYYASPVLAGDTLYCLRRDGTVFVGRVKADGFEILAKNKMEDTFVASPVPVDGRLLLRGTKALYCLGAD